MPLLGEITPAPAVAFEPEGDDRMSKRVLRCDLRIGPNGDIHGPVTVGDDSVAVLEAIYSVLEVFSEASGVPPQEVAADLYRLASGKVK